MKFAVEWCRSGKGPIFVEAHTYRYHGHSMSDPGKLLCFYFKTGVSYRSRDEVSAVRANRDCIDLIKKRITDNNWMSEKELKVVLLCDALC